MSFIATEPLTAMHFQGFVPEEAIRESLSLAVDILEDLGVPSDPELKVLSPSCFEAQ